MREQRPRRWLHLVGLGKPRPDESAALEVEHHIAELTDRLVAEGLHADEARSEAERHFGDPARYAAKMRRLEEATLRRGRWSGALEMARQSFVSVARTARREPGFTAAVVITLALGIGANATMYGIIDRLLLRGPEHVVDPEEVVRVLVENPEPDFGVRLQPYVAYADYSDWKAHGRFESVAAYETGGWDVVETDGSLSPVRVQQVSPEMFPLLGVDPVFGRFFSTDDIRSGATPTAVLSFDYWRSRYGADRAVLGQIIRIDGRLEYTVIGVAPRHFTGPTLSPVDLWVPLELPFSACLADRRCSNSHVVARLRDGVTVEAAAEEATALHLQGRRDMIDGGRYSSRTRVVLASLIAARGPDATGEGRVAGWLAGVAIVVLLVGCANVASLMIARSIRRRRETDVRLALGAGRGTIVGQSMLEALILASLGGALALVIARWGGHVIRSTLLPDVYFPSSTLTPRLLVFTFMVTAWSAVLASCVPAFRSRAAAVGPLGFFGASSRRSRVRDALTAAQAAMAVVLLVGGGLFVRSLDRLESLDLGLDVDELASVTLSFPATTDRSRQRELWLEASRRLAELSSVRSTTTTSMGLGSSALVSTRVRGLDSIPRLLGGGPYVSAVPPNYFSTVGLTVTRGEGFSELNDVTGSERVAVVSQTMARTLWPTTEPIGQCLLFGATGDECMRVIGVVEDAARNGYSDAPFMIYYIPQQRSTPNTMYVRAASSVDDVVRDANSVLEDFPGIRSARVLPLRERLDPQARPWKLGATMFMAFGLLALIVASVGIYSLLAFEVAQRTREIGIRSALGARKGRLLSSVVAHGMLTSGVGVALGGLGAWFAAPYAQDLLFETSARDPWVLGSVGAFLLAVSILASLVPALRATRVDPVTALKAD